MKLDLSCTVLMWCYPWFNQEDNGMALLLNPFYIYICMNSSLHSYMWLDLPEPITYAHNGKESYHYQSIDVHKCLGVHWWMSLVSLYTQPPCWKSQADSFMMWAIDLYIYCVILSTMGYILGHLTLNIAEVYCSHHFMDIPCPPPLYKCLWFDKNNLKWFVTQLAVHCGVGSLIAIKL